MREGLLGILTRQRRRLIGSRSAEAAGAGAICTSLTAAVILGGRILAGRFPLIGASVCAIPLLVGGILAASSRLRGALHPQSAVGWTIAAVTGLCGAAAAGGAAASILTAIPAAQVLAIVPAGVLAAVVAAVAAAATLESVAIDVDRRAGLRERLSTALELASSSQETPFAEAIEAQAIGQAASRMAHVHFWQRTRATVGAVGLALLTAALMLPWEPLESAEAARQRRWREVSGRTGEMLNESLSAVADALAGSEKLVGQLGRLEGLAEALRQGRPEQADNWQGAVVDLDQLAKALSEALASEDITAADKRRIAALLAVVERASAEIVAAMSGEAEEVAERPPPPPPQAPPPPAWVKVYDPRYAATTEPATTAPTADDAPTSPIPFDQAWADARRQAGESIRTQAVPTRYRSLIRDFFAADD